MSDLFYIVSPILYGMAFLLLYKVSSFSLKYLLLNKKASMFVVLLFALLVCVAISTFVNRTYPHKNGNVLLFRVLVCLYAPILLGLIVTNISVRSMSDAQKSAYLKELKEIERESNDDDF